MQPFGSHANASKAASRFKTSVILSFVSSYQTRSYNAVFTSFDGVILVELHHEMLKHKPMRHVDVPTAEVLIGCCVLRLRCASYVVFQNHLIKKTVYSTNEALRKLEQLQKNLD